MNARVRSAPGSGVRGVRGRPIIVGAFLAAGFAVSAWGQDQPDATQAVSTAFRTAFAKECTTDLGCGYQAIATSVDRQLARLLDDPNRAEAIRAVLGEGLKGEIGAILQATDPLDLKKPSSSRDRARAYLRFMMTSPLVGRSDREVIFKAAVTALEGKAVRRDSDETWRRWLLLVAIASAEDPERRAAEDVGLLLRPVVEYAVKSRRWTMIEQILAEKDCKTLGVCQTEMNEREKAARTAQAETARADLASIKEFDGYASRSVRASILRDCSDASEFSATVWRSMSGALGAERPPATTAKALYEQDLRAGHWADAGRWIQAAAAGKLPADELWAPYLARWQAEISADPEADATTRSGMASVLRTLETTSRIDPHPLRTVTADGLSTVLASTSGGGAGPGVEAAADRSAQVERVLSRSGGMGMDAATLSHIAIAAAERAGAAALTPVWMAGSTYFSVADDGRRRESFRQGMLEAAARMGACSFLNDRLARRDISDAISTTLKDAIETTLDREQNGGTPSEAAVLFYLRAAKPYGLRERWKSYLEGEGAYFRQRTDLDDAVAIGDCRAAVDAAHKIRSSSPTRSKEAEDIAIDFVLATFAKDQPFPTGGGVALGESIKTVCAWRPGLRERFRDAVGARRPMSESGEIAERGWIDCLEAGSLWTREEIADQLLTAADGPAGRLSLLRRLTARWRGLAGLERAWQRVLADATRSRDWASLRDHLKDPNAGEALTKLYFDGLRRDLEGRDLLIDASEAVRVLGATMTVAGTDEMNKIVGARLRQELAAKDLTPEFLDRLMMECGSWGIASKEMLPARRRAVELTPDQSPLLEGRVKSLLETSDRPDGASPAVIRLVTRVLVAQRKQSPAIDWAHAGEKQSAFTPQDAAALKTVREWVVKRDAEAKLYGNFTMDGSWTGTLAVEGATTTTQLTLTLSPTGQSARYSPLAGTLTYDRSSVPVTLVSMNRDARTVSLLLKEAVQLHALLDPQSMWECELKFTDEVGKSIQLLLDRGSGASKVTISLTRS